MGFTLEKKNKNKLIAGVVSASLLLTGAGTDVRAAGKTAIRLNRKKISIVIGRRVSLKIAKKNIKKIKSVKWSTADKRVARVSSKGKVRAVKAGKTTISCIVRYQKRDSKRVLRKVLKCTVTVRPAPSAAATTAPGAGSPSAQPSNLPAATSMPGKTDDPQIPATGMPSAEPSNSEQPGTEPPMVSGEPLPQESLKPTGVTEQDVSFSRESGTYDSEFELTLTSQAGDAVFYTTDGSDPRTSDTRAAYTSGILVKSRKGDTNVVSAVSPDLFDSMNYKIEGENIISKCTVPSDGDVDKCTVVRAVSVGSDGSTSDVVSKTYFIGRMSEHIDRIAQSCSASGQKLAVVSITMEQEDLFDHETGIYVKGKCFEDSLSQYIDQYGSLEEIQVERDLTSNFKQKGREWERECHVEYFESDGTDTTCKLSQDCGIRIQGNYSRENVQKSFRLYARADYGVKNFKYPFFGSELKDDQGQTMQKFKTLVLRNGGNDAFNYKYKDILTQSFVHDRAYETLHGRPCVLYLNGEYWGYYVLQDDMSDHFLEEKHGVNKDHVVLYKGTDDAKYAGFGYKLDEGELPAGVTEEDYYLQDTLNYLDGNDFSEDDVYQEFMEQYMDEQSAVDYYATMIYLNNGYDWPGKNWSIWRTTVQDDTNAYSDNRWRFCLFDLDLTTEPTWSIGDSGAWRKSPLSSLARKSSHNVIMKIFGNLIENEGFRQKLADTVAEIGTGNYAVDAVEQKADVYKKMYSPLSDQFQRRFNSNRAIWFNGEGSHNANLSFLRQRPSYLPELVSSIETFG